MVVFGNEQSGKTSLIFNFVHGKMPSEFDPVIEDCYNININIDKNKYSLKIMDTPGDDDYQSISDKYIEPDNGFLLVFSIDDYDGFQFVKNKYKTIEKRKFNMRKIPLLLMGNKKDFSENERKVSYDEAKQFAESLGIEYIEVSPNHNINVKEGFLLLIKKMIKPKEESKGKGKRCIII